MVFSSMVFLCAFLPVVFLLSRLSKSIRWQNGLLIVSSLIFYAYGEPRYVLLMLVSVLANWLFGLAMEKEPKKAVLIMAVILNIGLLFVFKYLNMAVELINGLGLNLPLPNLALPVGISFFTFQALSYVIDVYRGQVKAQKSFWHVLLYISLFPQLIAGPIVKYHDIERAIEHRTLDSDKTALGFRRFIVGLSKKVLIANTLALCADTLYAASPDAINICSAWLAALCYLFQIYYDFSAYSDMAIGLGEIFGFHFNENFNYPYSATSIQDFWRRWHISLTTWFREYLYIPLGGNRKGRLRTAVNKMIVFLSTGLWHGANLTFLVWGLWHGLFMMASDGLKAVKWPKFLGWIVTMLIVIVGFVIFRADSLSQAWFMISRMFTGFESDAMQNALFCSMLSPVLIAALAAAAIGSFPIFKKIDWNGKMQPAGYVFSICLLVICMLALSAGTYNPFIYFRF